MKRILTALASAALFATAMQAQAFFSFNAGTDGVNFNVTNVPPLFPAVVVAPPPAAAPVCIPLLRGVEYPAVSPKHYRKAVKRYRKAVRHGMVPAAGVVLPGGIVVGYPGAGYYYDDDDFDDDYDDWLEDQYKHHKKMYKKYKKMHKHHKHHHHDYDDDDD